MTLESAGVPTCTVITDVFAFKTRKEAEVLEMAALPLVILPHPVGQLPADRMRDITDQHLAEIRFALTGADADLVAWYRERTRSEPFSAVSS